MKQTEIWSASKKKPNSCVTIRSWLLIFKLDSKKLKIPWYNTVMVALFDRRIEVLVLMQDICIWVNILTKIMITIFLEVEIYKKLKKCNIQLMIRDSTHQLKCIDSHNKGEAINLKYWINKMVLSIIIERHKWSENFKICGLF